MSRILTTATNVVIALIIGIGKFLAWFLNHKAVYYPLTAIAVVGAGFYFWQAQPFKPRPPTPQEITVGAKKVVDAKTAKDLATLAADDGRNPEQHKFMAHAALNLSEQRGGLTIEQIYQEKLTLSAPSEESDKWPRYLYAADVGSDDNYQKAVIEVNRILSDDNRRKDWQAQPCLKEITRYIRPPKPGIWRYFGVRQSETAMERDGMALVYDDRQGAKYYSPPGSAKCQ